ncbi:MAG: hypothetical protein AB1814_05290 [Thermodesulfobacteriota bacterium]
MKRYLLPLLILAAVLGCGGSSSKSGSGPAVFSPAPDPANWLNRTVAELKIRLKLTPAQTTQVRAILKDGLDQKERLRPEGDRYGNIQEMNKLFARMRQVDRATEASLAKVLDKDQLDGYRTYLKEQRKRLGEGRAPADAGPASGREKKPR